MTTCRARLLPALFGLALLCAFVLLGAVPAAAAPGENDVIMIVETETGYTSFPAAAAAVTEDQTITLLKDITLETTSYTLNKDTTYTINLNKHTLQGGLGVTAGTVTIKNGTLLYAAVNDSPVLSAGEDASITLENVTLKNTGTGETIGTSGNGTIAIPALSACYPPQDDWATAKAVYVWDSSDESKLALIPETGVYYKTLPNAVAAVGDKQTIVLLKDIQKSGTRYHLLTQASYTITIDLNGHTCCALGATVGNVTVKNGILSSDSNEFNTLEAVQSTAVTLENVIVKHTGVGGKMAINNAAGNINLAAGSACYPPQKDWATAKAVYVWDSNDESKLALIPETGVYYETLALAAAAVQDNQTIALLKDITTTAANSNNGTIMLAVNKIYTLDLNGRTVAYGSGANVPLISVNAGAVTIKNGTVKTAKEKASAIQIMSTNPSTVTLEALTVTASGEQSWAINANGVVEILSGTYTGVEDAVRAFDGGTGKTTITAGHFICTADGTTRPGALYSLVTDNVTLSKNSRAVYMDSNKEIKTTDFISNAEATDVFVYVDSADLVPPDAPTSVKATPGNGNATLTWTAPASWGSFPAWYYEVSYRESGAADGKTILVDASATGTTLPDLKKGRTYSVSVKALNRSGDGTPSSEISFTVSSGGGRGGGSTVTSNVTTNKTENGSVSIDKKSPVKGDTVTITAKPQEGYEVDKVTVTDKKGNALAVTPGADGTYSFVYGGEPVEIVVTFKKITEEPTPPTPSEPGKTDFGDVPAGAWYEDAVLYVTEAGLFKGTEEGKFSPDAPMTRGMLVTVLGRLAGIADVGAGETGFTDVAPAAYYASFVAWAAENGIVTGMGEDSFAPEGEITREQLAVMLYRFAQWAKLDISTPEGELPDFSDAGAVSDWATEAMQWAVAAGILNGRTDGTLDPGGTATRAEVAAMLMRFAALLG